jgi:hypothetical protein
MKKFFVIFSSSLILFFIINFFLSIILSPINKFITVKILNKPVYTEESLKALGIERKDENVFYNETWNRSYKYLQFAEHYEAETNNGQYVNVSKNDGRKINNIDDCKTNFYFYGSSLTFGYNVRDSQTIPAYFKDILDKIYSDHNYCVYNFGSANYFSTQENILFQTHILDNRINTGDFVFFIDGESENGNSKSRISSHLEKLFNGVNARMFTEIKFSFQLFWDSLPTTKIFNIFKGVFKKENNSPIINNEISINKQIEIKDVFQKNIFIRDSVCKNLTFKCFTFLQPFPNIHGIYDKNLYGERLINKSDLDKYNLLKDTKFIFDISSSLDKNKNHSFVDARHYSPESNKLIAESIYDIAKIKINESR